MRRNKKCNITTAERIGIEKGLQEGLQEGLQKGRLIEKILNLQQQLKKPAYLEQELEIKTLAELKSIFAET